MLALAAALVSLALIVLTLRNVWAARQLPVIASHSAPPDAPLVSILIPARNEARVIERCVRAALSQRYPAYEVIVIDDSSDDGTAAILARLQAADPRLQVIEAGPLPPGWKGKQHALSRGYALARGDWLLFLDADTAAGSALLAALSHFAQRQGLDLLTPLPLLELGSFWERAILPAFASLIGAVFPLEEINDPRSEVAMANGQCIFIRREAYEAAGTHAAIRDEIAEDVALARQVKGAGRRLFMADGSDLIRVRMYHNGREVVEGLAKNAMAGVEIGGRRTLRGVARQTFLALGPFLLAGLAWQARRAGTGRAFAATGATATCGIAVTIWGWCRMYRRIFQQPARYGLLYPLGIVAYGLIGLYAALRLRLGKGVVWKGRTYEKL